MNRIIAGSGIGRHLQSAGNTGDQERSFNVPSNVNEPLTAKVLPAITAGTHSCIARGPIGNSPWGGDAAEVLAASNRSVHEINTAPSWTTFFIIYLSLLLP